MSVTKIFRKILIFFNLDAELENPDLVYEEIKKGVVFRGTNLWILIFAIVIASVGLNMNSTAVIIGAMLISPLMGPINGMGYSIATYDISLLKVSAKNFSFAIIASLFASTTYFAITPVSTAQSELLARTSPTIYDVIIALFGGFAGIVAISSRFKGNVIPGVAIATALMPPLCTAGYGIATAQFNFFFGAFYLFTINTIFIAIASVWISQILKFPIRGEIDEIRKRRINRIITVVITAVLLPSIYFGYRLVEEERFIQNTNKYISNISLFEGNYLLKYETDPSLKKISLIYVGTTLTDEQRNRILEKAKDFNLDNAEISIQQGFALEKYETLSDERLSLREQIINFKKTLENREAKIDSIRKKEAFGEKLFEEIKVLYPQIVGGSYSETYYYHDTLSVPGRKHIIILDVKSKLSSSNQTKIKNWIKKRLNSDNIKVIYEY